MKSAVFILRLFETLLIVAGITFAMTFTFMPDKGMIQIKSIFLAYAISLIANLMQRTQGSIVLLIFSLLLITAGIAQEASYLPMTWELPKLIQDTTVHIVLYPAILLAIVDWLSFTSLNEMPSINKRAITADERVAMIMQSSARRDK